MTLDIVFEAKNKLFKAHSSLNGATVGGFATLASGEMPDRCRSCFDPETMNRNQATGWYVCGTLRQGFCRQCAPELEAHGHELHWYAPAEAS